MRNHCDFVNKLLNELGNKYDLFLMHRFGIFSRPHFYILGFRTSLNNLIKMGCQLSKSIKYKRSRKDTGSRPLNPSKTEGCSTQPYCDAVPDDTVTERKPAVASELDSYAASAGQRAQDFSDQQARHLSCRTTDSGDSAADICEVSIRGSPSKKSPSIFDDDVLAALAAADQDEAVRQEKQFLAIMSMTTAAA